MASTLIIAVNLFAQLLVYLILARAVMSWFFRPGDRLYPIYTVIIRVTEPILGPARRLMGHFGRGLGVDFSPVVAVFMIYILNWAIVALLKIILF